MDEVVDGNELYIDKYYASISHLFYQTWTCRNPHPHEVVFKNGYEFRSNFFALLYYFFINHFHMIVKKPQDKSLAEQVHKVM